MSADTEDTRWLKDLMAAHWDRRNLALDVAPTNVSTSRRNGQDNDKHFLHFSNPPILSESAENIFLASPVGVSVDEKVLTDEERMVEGDDKNIYPSIPVLVTLTIALMIAIFMIGLDTNIIGKP